MFLMVPAGLSNSVFLAGTFIARILSFFRFCSLPTAIPGFGDTGHLTIRAVSL
jgi:hypothetical protein